MIYAQKPKAKPSRRSFGQKVVAYLAENEKENDVIFLVGEEEIQVRALKLALKAACPAMDKMFKQAWDKQFKKTKLYIALPELDPLAFHIFLKVLCWDDWDAENVHSLNLEPETIAHLIEISKLFEMITLQKLFYSLKPSEFSQLNDLHKRSPANRSTYKETKIEKLMQNIGIHTGGSMMVKGNVHVGSFDSPVNLVKEFHQIDVPTSNFTGREKQLQQIHSRMQECSSHDALHERIIVLCGLGGIGKTEIALKYAQQFITEPVIKNIAYIDAESLDPLTDSFNSLARLLNISTQTTNILETVNGIYKHFSDHIGTGLFIFDNALQFNDSEFGIYKYLPKSLDLKRRPLVLITSRDTEWGDIPKENIITVDELTENESVELVKKKLKLRTNQQTDCNIKAIRNLAQSFQGYPLGLCLAASNIDYLDEDDLHTELQAYISRIEKPGGGFMNHAQPDAATKYQLVMHNVWDMTLEKIKRLADGDEAIQLLNLMSFLPADNITVEIMKDIFNFTFNNTLTKKPFFILKKKSMISIKKISSLSVTEAITKIGIHRLVQHNTREKLDFQKDYSYLNYICNFICNKKLENHDHYSKILVLCAHEHLKNREWPHHFIRYSVLFCSFMTFFEDESPESSFQLIQDVYEFLGVERMTIEGLKTDKDALNLFSLCLLWKNTINRKNFTNSALFGKDSRRSSERFEQTFLSFQRPELKISLILNMELNVMQTYLYNHCYQLLHDFYTTETMETPKNLPKIQIAAKVTKEKVEKLLADALNYYHSTMVDIFISNSRNDTFETSHTGVLNSALDKIINSTAITCPISAQNIINQLKSQIEDAFKEMCSRKTEFQHYILQLHKEALDIYTQGMSRYIQSNEYSANVQIDTEHSFCKNQATNHLKNEFENIKFYSKTVDGIKSGDVTKLETRLEQIWTQIQETNNCNQQAAEQRMEASVNSIMDIYVVDMDVELNGATLTTEQLQDFHNKISTKSLKTFARVNSKSPLFPKWNDLLKTNLQNELHAYQQQISAAEDEANRVGEALILDGINYYREAMREAIANDEDSYEKTHLRTHKVLVDSLKNNGEISNKYQLGIFVRKLEIRIQNAYKEFCSNISQNRIKIQDNIQNVMAQSLETYRENMTKKINLQNCQADDAKLQAQHSQELSAAQNKLTQCYDGIQTSSRIFKDQQALDVKSLSTSIDVLFQQLKQKHHESINKSQNRLSKHIKNYTKQYVEGMTWRLNEEIVLGEKFEILHTAVAQPILENFTLVWSASFLCKEGEERLLKEISSQKNKFNEEMTSAHNAIHESLGLSVQTSAGEYKEEMNKILHVDDQVFSESHQLYQKEAIETIEKLNNHQTEKYIYKYLSDLQSEIMEAQVQLLDDRNRCKEELELAIEDAKKFYEAQMNRFFNSIGNYISPSLLEKQHKIKMAEAIVTLQDKYKKHTGLLGQENKAVLKLCESIQHLYDKFQGINYERLSRLQEKQQKFLEVIKADYTRSVKMLAETEKCEDEFVRKNEDVVQNCKSKLLDELKPKHAAAEFTSELVDDLKMYIEDQFRDFLAIFRSTMAQERAAVTSALIQARQFYNEEMSKRVQAQDWFEPWELSRLNTEVIELYIAKCKNVNLTPTQEEQLRDVMAVAYLKYLENNTLKTPVHHPAIGIDFGTTYSRVGVYLNGEVKIIPNNDLSDETKIASYVAFSRDHTVDVGNSAKDQAFLKPQNTIFDAKRLIGRCFSDPIVQEDIKRWPFSVIDDNDKPKIQVFDKQFRPEEISAKVLIKIKTIAESYLKRTVKAAVLTVPAYFNEGQRQATRDAAQIAGLKVTLVNEPTAAAIAYKLHRTDEPKRNVLIFHLGRDTFDVAVLEVKGKDIVVKGTGSDTHLGGEDFNNNIVSHIIERVKTKFDIDLSRGRDSRGAYEKFKACERLGRVRDRSAGAKRNLSKVLFTFIAIDRVDENFDLREKLTREEFEDLNIALFTKCIDIVQTTLDDAKLGKTDIDNIVLVGGSTRIPKVQELLRQFFDNKKELTGTINPDEVVAHGAAIHAALLHGKQATRLSLSRLRDSVQLTNVTADSLRTWDEAGRMTKSEIIKAQTAEPFRW